MLTSDIAFRIRINEYRKVDWDIFLAKAQSVSLISNSTFLLCNSFIRLFTGCIAIGVTLLEEI